ncbi:pseudouridine synthase [Sungkyunkwania multivorans]|uniref:Pseudouridine synthase n=1 Tax=Sungkyunkwania multivorans TaxID=1173618 RepID=A0ABW3D0E2_9FLAO
MTRNDRSGKGKPFGKQGAGPKKRDFSKGEKPSRQRPSAKSTGNKDEIRLNKFIANAGICSRRDADMHIAVGSVTVNGKVVTEMGYKVKITDEVRFDGQRIYPEKPEYILLNKPKGFLATTKDEKGRKTVMDLIANATDARVVPVGRLDRPTTGLILFTNDGQMAKKLTNAANDIRQIYHVSLDRKLSQADFNKIKEGITLDDGLAEVDEISWVHGATKREVGIKIHSIRHRLVRRIFESLNYEIVSLDRVVFAGLTKKDLPRGHWRHLTKQEVINLGM